MLKKNIEERRTRRQARKQDKDFKEGIINTLKLLIHNKDNIIDYVFAHKGEHATKEQALVNEYKEQNPDRQIICFAVKDKSGDVLFMVTKIYGGKQKTQYEFNFGNNAPFIYFNPDEKTREELYKMMNQEYTIRDRQGHMIEDAKQQKALLDWLNKERQ